MNKNRIFMTKMILSSLIRRRSRIAVALVGIAIGATVLLGMITLCFDIPRQMSKEFRSYGANMLFMPAGDANSLNLADVHTATQLLPQDKIVGITPYRYDMVRSNMLPYTLVGTDFIQVRKTSPYWQIEGNWPVNDNEILIGIDIAQSTRLKPGSVIPLAGKSKDDDRFDEEMVISGIIKTGRAEDGFIFINLNKFEQLFHDSGKADVIELSISAPEQELKHLITLIGEQDIAVEPHLVNWVTRSETAVLGKLETLMYLVTFIVLLLTMICVATTMMTVIMERRKEIGLKKAIGAENRSIASEFLCEGLILGITGGIVGALCGLLFAQLISINVFGRSIEVELYLIPVTVTVSVLVTIVACLIPVKRAVEVEPALVLRGE